MNQTVLLGDVHPLTAVQREIWFDQAVHGDAPIYKIGGYVQIDGLIDAARFERAVNLLVQAHDTLRLVLVPGRDEDGVPQQAIAKTVTVRVPLHDFSSAADPHAAARAWAAQRLATPFPLNGEPLFCFELAKLGDACFCLVLNFHHLIVDGWAIELLTGSLAEIYSALEANGASELPAPDTPSYVEFIEHDLALRASPQFERHRAYWLDKYRSVPDPLFEPRYRERFNGLTAPAGYHTLALPRAFYERIIALARACESTPFHVMLGVLYVYFSRTAQRDDFAVGVPVLNRPTARMKLTAGMFTGVSPVRLQFDGALRFDELLRSIAQVLKQDYRHQRFPVSELNRSLGLRQSQRAQVFDLSVSYERDDHDLRFGSSGAHGYRCSNGHEQLPLALNIRENRFDEQAWIHFTYNRAYFERDEIEALGARFEHLLHQVLDDPRVALASLALPTPAESGQLKQWNAETADLPQDELLHRLFEARVAEAPDAIALGHEGRYLTYADLNAQANRIAHKLIARGVQPDSRVAICVERRPTMVAALLGILKAGAAYVPLDPAYPAERLAYTLRDSAPVAVLVQRDTRDLLGEQAVLAIDLDADIASDAPTHNPVVPGLTAEHLAYVIYTSGSTGQPKGVMVEHRNVANLLHSMRQTLRPEVPARMVALTTLAFDIAGLELFLPLVSGTQIVLLDRATALDPFALDAAIRESGATIMQATPATWRTLLDCGWSGAPDLKALCGGEALPGELAQRLSPKVAALWNVYGPTETTIWSTAALVNSGHVDTHASAPIGRPIANTQIYVLDGAGQPVPVGVSGELYIGGAGVARGYFNRDDLTAERFLVDPFSDAPGARMYRTGDLARFLPDGNIEYLGRNDHQVKLRGFRIELGEIEARLSRYDGVREAVVIAREDTAGDKRLVAYYTVAEQPTHNTTAATPVDAEQLRTHAGAVLPEYMVPSAYVKLAAFPLTPNGKLDRRALPAPEGDAYAARRYEAPHGETEQALADVWSQLLGVAQVSRTDSFFQLGGHSLLALKVVSRLRQRLSRDVPPDLLFRHPTLSAFAAALDATSTTTSQERALSPRGLRDAPLSLPQERLWVLWRLDPDSAAYNVSGALELDGTFDAQAAQRAIDALVQRHGMLRTRFGEIDDVPRQLILAPERSAAAWRWETVNLQQADHTSLATQLRVRAREPFDLEHGPLLRATLFALAPQRHVLHFVMHHIASDGWSIDVLLREFAAGYRAARRGEAADLPVLPVQYADYAAWQRERFDGAGSALLDAQLGYWRDRLAGLSSVLDLPTEHDRSRSYDARGARVAMRIPAPLAARAEALAREAGATLFMVLLAALDVLLYRYSGATDVPVAVPVAGRDRLETEGLIGFFVNTLVMRTALSGAQPFATLLDQVRADSIAAQANRDVPFDRIVAELQLERRASGNPLAQVKFMLHDGFDASVDLDGVQCRLLDADASDVRFELALDVARGPHGLDCTFTYATGVYDEAFIVQFAQHYADLLAQAVDTPQRALGDFTLRDTEEGDEVVADALPVPSFGMS
ncbi:MULTISPECIES: non-ribosomal peptide synthetase [Paraburkholderia]|uniref:non-ribosomal peptide synthetase n=1 Tax=Paraburkholderia TaxID=1822464 RepID=UPI002252777C|nr:MULTISPECIES: non-ribosomal peptide synthetase [Paraburkholderia]MCX4160101.1 amino acid adenylation domain-containing protein [Paraburkholderia megapolitana]MDN7155601.1 amino acid adenylation domain-containing protein [Paraburkholderia sp. CHISQ3]MDQ6492645.1 amino acid adenylation domain-containing protein [Paraburkholderia megapolitana]